jgi:hypothetical protein
VILWDLMLVYFVLGESIVSQVVWEGEEIFQVYFLGGCHWFF